MVREDSLKRALLVVGSREQPSSSSSSASCNAAESSPKVAGDGLCCVVCQDKTRQMLFMPCKHLVCCSECGREPSANQGLRMCPVCRAEIQTRFSVYL
jgi:hypothetical protein